MAGDYTWTFDATTGTFKNHFLSAKVREAAVADTKVMNYVDTEPGYGKRKGESVTITRIKNIAEPVSGKFNENQLVPIDTYSQSTVAVTVSYWGRGIQFTEMADILSHYDVADKIQRKLKQQMALVLDTGAAAAFKTAKICYIPTSTTGGTFDTDGTPSTSALENLSVAHVKVIRDYMQDTIHVPGYMGGDKYICLASTKALRGVKNDPEFALWRSPNDTDSSFNRGVVGTIENIDFVEINHVNALSNAKGTGSVLGEALFFGDDAVTMALVRDPELHVAIPGNFGMQNAIAWIGMLEFALVWDTATDGEARVIRVTSS